jgi:plastocyanin
MRAARLPLVLGAVTALGSLGSLGGVGVGGVGVGGVGAAMAGTLRGSITVVDAEGKPGKPAGAVVYLVGFSEEPTREVATIEQQGRKFLPELLAITAGQEVSFPNRDAFLHNVFSTSSTRPFDLGSYKQGESKKKSFPRPGVIDVYCNIHPEMAATILVLPNRRWARVDEAGRYQIEGIPEGKWTAFAYTRLAAKPVSAAVEIKDSGATSLDLTLTRGAARPHTNKYGEAYRDPRKYR